MRARGKKHIRTRREVGNILQEENKGMSANEIAAALVSRRKRSYIQTSPISVAQFLRGARGVKSQQENRELDCGVKPVKIYIMDDYEGYNNWLKGE
jgi:hypothetical protein